MRTYLSTKREHEALYDWIGGRLHRDQNTCLHTLLNRTTKHKQQLTRDISLLLAHRKLAIRHLHNPRNHVTLTK